MIHIWLDCAARKKSISQLSVLYLTLKRTAGMVNHSLKTQLHAAYHSYQHTTRTQAVLS